jgi:hypothetical protein
MLEVLQQLRFVGYKVFASGAMCVYLINCDDSYIDGTDLPMVLQRREPNGGLSSTSSAIVLENAPPA